MPMIVVMIQSTPYKDYYSSAIVVSRIVLLFSEHKQTGHAYETFIIPVVSHQLKRASILLLFWKHPFKISATITFIKN